MQLSNRKLVVRRENGWLKVVILVIAWLIIISLARDVWRIRSGFNRITESEQRLEVEEARNLSLKKKLDLVVTEEYQEKLIREKLNMAKEGEVLVVMPKKAGLGRSETPKEEEIQNWEKWWKLLRG